MIVFAVLIMFMFRYVVGVIVWLVLACTIIISITGTIVLWLVKVTGVIDKKSELNLIPSRIVYSQEKGMEYTDTINQRRTNSFLAFAIIATIATVIICLVVLVLRKRIQLVIALFKEAGKALSNMPLLLLEPILVI